jgi:tRNA pseudouridine38-40 synthase
VRWRADISYDGTGFSGWATQPGLRTVQEELETWLTRILRLEEPARLVCAGRTDSGVHARGQVVHLDLPDDTLTDPTKLLRRLQRVLHTDLVVTDLTLAPPGFDARFSAVWRRYVYRLADGERPPDPLLRAQVTHWRHRVDLDTVNEAATTLLGLRDFGAFCRRRAGATTIRTLLDLVGHRVATGPAAGVIELTVRADAFCHSMVRSLVGGLVAVGTGQRDRDWLVEVTRRAARDTGVLVMPAQGLTLEEVGYPADDELAHRARESRTRRELSPT